MLLKRIRTIVVRAEDLACIGSVLTCGKIVWGSQDKTDPASKPLIDKPFLAELGSVNPIVVVPEIGAHETCSITACRNAHVKATIVDLNEQRIAAWNPKTCPSTSLLSMRL